MDSDAKGNMEELETSIREGGVLIKDTNRLVDSTESMAERIDQLIFKAQGLMQRGLDATDELLTVRGRCEEELDWLNEEYRNMILSASDEMVMVSWFDWSCKMYEARLTMLEDTVRQLSNRIRTIGFLTTCDVYPCEVYSKPIQFADVLAGRLGYMLSELEKGIGGRKEVHTVDDANALLISLKAVKEEYYGMWKRIREIELSAEQAVQALNGN